MTKIALKLWQKILICCSFLFSVILGWRNSQSETCIVDGKKYPVASTIPSDIANEINLIKKDGEILNRRTKTSKTYYLGNGRYKTISHLYPIHFKNSDGHFEEIDPKLINGVLKGSVYEASLLKGAIGYTVKRPDDKGGFTFRLKSIGDITPEYSKPTIEKNLATWKQIIPGVDLIISFEKSTVRIWRKIYSEDFPHNIIWDVEEFTGNKQISMINHIEGYDAKNQSLLSKREITNESIEGDIKRYQLEDVFTGEVIHMSEDTRRKSIHKDKALPLNHVEQIALLDPDDSVYYPVMIDADVTITTTPAANGDDGFVYDAPAVTLDCNWINTTDTRARVSHTPSGWGFQSYKRLGYVRFSGLTIPLGSTINSATVLVHQDPITTGTGNVWLFQVSASNPAQPTTCLQVWNAASIATRATITHTAGGDVDKTWTATTMVQTMVNMYKYNNDAMMFKMWKETTNGAFYFDTKDSGSNEPTLTIDYTEPNPLTGAIIIVD